MHAKVEKFAQQIALKVKPITRIFYWECDNDLILNAFFKIIFNISI